MSTPYMWVARKTENAVVSYLNSIGTLGSVVNDQQSAVISIMPHTVVIAGPAAVQVRDSAGYVQIWRVPVSVKVKSHLSDDTAIKHHQTTVANIAEHLFTTGLVPSLNAVVSDWYAYSAFQMNTAHGPQTYEDENVAAYEMAGDIICQMEHPGQI